MYILNKNQMYLTFIRKWIQKRKMIENKIISHRKRKEERKNKLINWICNKAKLDGIGIKFHYSTRQQLIGSPISLN